MNPASTLGYVVLVLLFGVPTVFTNVPQHALTQAMIVALGFIIMVGDE